MLICYNACCSPPAQQLKTSIQLAQRPRFTYFRPILREENWASWQHIAYSASRTFFGGFSADENSAANTANGAGLGSTVNYRPISNLSTVSKILERLAQTRLRPHLMSSANFSQFQSAYRQGHCTETALIDVLDNVYTAADVEQVTVLIGLDLSAAFDTVCHQTLLQRLETEFGVSETALSFIESYLTDRKQFVKLGQHKSTETKLKVGVPQGSVLY